jgi:hypothetical protein
MEENTNYAKSHHRGRSVPVSGTDKCRHDDKALKRISSQVEIEYSGNRPMFFGTFKLVFVLLLLTKWHFGAIMHSTRDSTCSHHHPHHLLTRLSDSFLK